MSVSDPYEYQSAVGSTTVVDSTADAKCFWLFSWIVNKNFSLKTQLLTLFSLLTIISGGVTLGICLGMLYALGDSAYSSSQRIILDNAQSNAANLGNVIAEAIEQRLTVVSQSVCMVSAQYSQVLLQYSNYSTGGTLLTTQQPSFREYNFVKGCNYPKCPKDFGSIYTRSRIPYLPGFLNGSIDHSSVYLYSSKDQVALRNDTTWNNAFTKNPVLNNVLNGLSYQDIDFTTLYSQGPNSTVMFYLSSQVFPQNSINYYSLHRTYPGILKNDTAYDPPSRPWNSQAPVGGVYFYGPYKETFTKQLVITLSSKQKAVISPKTKMATPVNVVAAAVMLIEDLAVIVNQIKYANNGFGVLLTSSKKVLVWANRTDIYNETTASFKLLSDYDPILDTYTLTDGEVIEYSDSAGNNWYVAVQTFFASGSKKTDSLIILVFSQKSLAEHPLTALQDNIDTTTSSVSTSTVIIVCVTIGAVMLLCFLLILYITHPLNVMRSISADIVKLSAEEEDQRDYTDVLSRAYYNITRSDEVGILASDYYHVICMLQNNVLKKRATPKFPPNPFFVNPAHNVPTPLNWPTFYHYISHTLAAIMNQATSVTLGPDPLTSAPAAPPSISTDGTLDVLGALTKQMMEQNSPPQPTSSAVNPYAVNNDDNEGTIELRDLEVGTKGNQYSTLPTTAIPAIEKEDVIYLTIAPSNKVGYLTSIKSQLYLLTTLLFAGMLIALVLTVVELHKEGATWTDDSTDDLVSVQVLNLEEIAETKANFVTSYFQQLSVDLLVAGSISSLIMAQQLNRSNFISNNYYLPSYSMDYYNNYAASVTTSYNFTGYFLKTDDNCGSAGSTCAQTQTSFETRLTSLFDLKLRSYFYNGNFVSFYQFALDSNGYTRYLPYQKSTTNSEPASCVIQDSPGLCHSIYTNSKCSNNNAYFSYPPYDARCRSWYQLGLSEKNATNDYAYFQYPRIASNGQYVLTGAVPIRYNNQFYGVLNSNYLISTLSNAINTLTILKSGYVYIINSGDNVTDIVLYPNLPSVCTTVICAEGFSTSEYNAFYENVLSRLAADPSLAFTTIYKKGGSNWRISTYPVAYGSVKYTLLATVPDSEVLEASNDTQDAIDKTVVIMIVVFVILMVVFLISYYFFTNALIHAVVTPINDLRRIFEKVKNEDYHHEIPKRSTSYDLDILMEALSNLLIALRFGSETFARGNPHLAERIFTEALQVFTLTNNQRGIGACYNNLAAVKLSKRIFIEAEELNKKAIDNARELIQQELKRHHHTTTLDGVEKEVSVSGSKHGVTNTPERQRLQRLLSDRQGNLVVTYLEQTRFSDAFQLLEQLLEEDKNSLYLKGCVVKQGILGQYYLKQGEISSAEKIFTSALTFIEQTESMLPKPESPPSNEPQSVEHKAAQASIALQRDESYSSKQIALYNLALLIEAKEKKRLEDKDITVQLQAVEVIIQHYLIALTQVPVMHTNTVKNILITIKRYLAQYSSAWGKNDFPQQIDLLAEQFDFQLTADKAGKGGGAVSGSAKRVVFAIDYSGSMSGTKIRSARENLEMIFNKHIHSDDSISIITFNERVTTILPLTMKRGNEETITNDINRLTSPNGSTAFYDAVHRSLMMLKSSTSFTSNDWIIALTDGDDNSSMYSRDTLIRDIAASTVGVIVVGIGSDVQTELLTQVAKASKKGEYVFAQGDKKSIDDAFGQVAEIIQSQIILEDI